jgi:hypothetical protein
VAEATTHNDSAVLTQTLKPALLKAIHRFRRWRYRGGVGTVAQIFSEGLLSNPLESTEVT